MSALTSWGPGLSMLAFNRLGPFYLSGVSSPLQGPRRAGEKEDESNTGSQWRGGWGCLALLPGSRQDHIGKK